MANVHGQISRTNCMLCWWWYQIMVINESAFAQTVERVRILTDA